jgi:hypothetical protein
MPEYMKAPGIGDSVPPELGPGSYYKKDLHL